MSKVPAAYPHFSQSVVQGILEASLTGQQEIKIQSLLDSADSSALESPERKLALAVLLLWYSCSKQLQINSSVLSEHIHQHMQKIGNFVTLKSFLTPAGLTFAENNMAEFEAKYSDPDVVLLFTPNKYIQERRLYQFKLGDLRKFGQNNNWELFVDPLHCQCFIKVDTSSSPKTAGLHPILKRNSSFKIRVSSEVGEIDVDLANYRSSNFSRLREHSFPSSPLLEDESLNPPEEPASAIKSDKRINVRMFCDQEKTPYDTSSGKNAVHKFSSMLSIGFTEQSCSSIHNSAKNSNSSTTEQPRMRRKVSFCDNPVSIAPSMLSTVVVKRTLSGNWESLGKHDELSEVHKKLVTESLESKSKGQVSPSYKRKQTAKLRTIHACSEDKLSDSGSYSEREDKINNQDKATLGVPTEFRVAGRPERPSLRLGTDGPTSSNSPKNLQQKRRDNSSEGSEEDIPRLKVCKYTAPETHFLK